jgi:hypothetical protein
VAALMFVVLGPGLAGADTAPVPPAPKVDVVHIEEVHGTLRFDAPETVDQGDQLEIVNDTNPKRVGPHTFSLVTKGSLPTTRAARQKCFTPRHICKAIAHWHGVKGEGPATINPAKAGAEGWSTMGSVRRKGDSWFTGVKPDASFAQEVSATPQTIYFMCAIHTWMHGKITVLPAGS